MTGRILVVEDEKLIQWSICERLRQDGYDCAGALTLAEARACFAAGDVSLVLLDLRLPDGDGMDLLDAFRGECPALPIIIVTANSTVESAVEAMRRGACDYVTKPFNLDALAIRVEQALKTSRFEAALQAQADQQRGPYGLASLAGTSAAMTRVRDFVAKVARSGAATILLQGESGVGKDKVARTIHYESARAAMPFMNITCTALPEALLESELFGHEKGAFTGAHIRKRGLFELADGGTVFLDEIGDLPPGMQAKLLRVLEDKAFRRVGGGADIRVDVRIIAATNRDLEAAVVERSFREDLFYRLSIIPVVLPPLRDRKEDIATLSRHFLANCCIEYKRHINDFDAPAIAKLMAHAWPGNVRELKNVIERAVLFREDGLVGEDDIMLGRSVLDNEIPISQPSTAAGVLLPLEGCRIEEVEKELLRQALERVKGNQTQTAGLLGITRDQVRYKMRKHGLDSGPAAS